MDKQQFSQFVQALNKFIDEYEKEHVQKYKVRDKESGHVLMDNLTLTDAEILISVYENTDKKDGNYTPDFYEISKQD